MNCRAIANILDLYMEKRLRAGRMRQVESHLEGCRACRALALPRSAFASPPLAVPGDFKANLKKRLAGSGSENAPEPAFSLFGLRREMVVMAAAGVAYAGLVFLLNWTGAGIPSQKYGCPEEFAVAGRIP